MTQSGGGVGGEGAESTFFSTTLYNFQKKCVCVCTRVCVCVCVCVCVEGAGGGYVTLNIFITICDKISFL